MTLDELDARNTAYRFDPSDVPWERLDEPGVLAGPSLLALLDSDLDPRELGRRVAAAFASLERDLIAVLEHDPPGGRSVELLLEEEHKHAAMFERLGAHLGTPDGWRPPDTFQRLLQGQAAPEQRRFLFWLHAVFFEELTVWIHDALDRDGGLQPAWLAAHRLHAREEVQHVLTDAAHLVESPLDAAERARLSRAFVLYVDRHLDAFFGLPERGRRLRELPLFQEILTHRAFRHTRAHAPYWEALGAWNRPVVLSGPDLPASDLTLPGALVRAAEGDHGLSFPGEPELSYADLHTAALDRLGGLQARGFRPRQAVVLVFDRPRAAVEALWACLLGGLVPALVPRPTGSARSESHRRLFRVASQLDAPVLCAGDPPAALADLGDTIRLETLHGVGTAHTPHPDDLALLQYSSGSLGQPRGVELTHRQVVANIHGMHRARGRPGERFASWLPLSHDMGLVGFHLAPVVLACPQLLAPTRTWIRDPAGWLDTLQAFGATVSGLTSSALPALLRPVAEGLDLSALHTLLVGAEPIDPGLVRAATARLAPRGLAADALCPAYGLAEATLAVTLANGPPKTLRVERDSLRVGARVVRADPHDEDVVELVALGRPIAGLELHAGREDEVVELRLSGASIARGYRGKPPWELPLATGDLGFVHQGQLYVCGRDKETFEVHGQTFHAHDVERVAREVPGVRGVALGLGEREPILFVVPVPAARAQKDELLGLVRRHLRLQLGFEPARLVALRPSQLLRTTSGKLRRHAIASAWRERQDVEAVDLVRGVFSDVLELPLAEIGPDDDFRALGGSSLLALEVHARLEERLGVALDQSVLDGATPRLLARRLHTHQRRRQTAPKRTAGPLAVVALAVRFPGAPDPDALWHLFREGHTSVRPVTRWSTEGLSSHAGALFDDVGAFDPGPFSLSDDEARHLDPQHRLALELCLEALAQAPPDTPRVGVYLACGDLEYGSPERVGAHTLLGSLRNMVAARVAATLGLTGPALAVDTACSSALVALHLAARAVRQGDCELALAGGVQLLLTPQGFRSFDAAGLLSRSGRSQPFDEAASGLVPGEGGGVVCVATTDTAERLGLPVLALLHGTAVTNDGGALSATAPSPDGQEAAIRAAWADAGRAPADASYLECHAAGTSVGDAVEVTAAARVFEQVAVGSAKGSLGHTLGVSGMAGLARTLLALQHGELPPSVGLHTPAARIRWQGLRPVRALRPWPEPQVAGVSSFGLGGTNAHVVLASSPRTIGPSTGVAPGPRLARALGAPQPPRVALMLAGPGAQHAGMAAALRHVPGFAALLARVQALADDDHVPLLQTFDDERCTLIEHAQTACFALTWALGRWLLDLGLVPDLVFGHSAGELSAAVLAGRLTLEEGWRLARERGRLMGQVEGGMLAVLGDLDTAPEGTWVAARNAPGQVVLAGSLPAIDAAEQALPHTRRLAITCPAHSPLLEPVAGTYLKIAEALPERTPTLPFLSTAASAGWAGQLLGPVDFEGALRAAADRGVTHFVDLGPSSGLASAAVATLPGAHVTALLARHDTSLVPTLRALARLVDAGALPRPAGVPGPRPRFARRRLWLDPPLETVGPDHALLRDHVVSGTPTTPAAWLYDLALHGHESQALERCIVLRPGGAGVLLWDPEGLADAAGTLLQARAAPLRAAEAVDLDAVRARCPALGSPRQLRARLQISGMVLGPSLWAVRALQLGRDELLVELRRPADSPTGHRFAPALLDSASQAAAALLVDDRTWVGFSVDYLGVHAPAQDHGLAWLRFTHRSDDLLVMDLDLVAPDGAPLVSVRGLSARPNRTAPPEPVTPPRPKAPAPPQALPDDLHRALRAVVGRRLRRDPDQLPSDQPFAQLGMDSLAAVEIAQQLERHLGRRLPVTLLFECPDLQSLEARLAEASP